MPNGENFNRLGECSKKVAATVAESSLPGSFRQSCVDDDKSTGSKGDWYNPDDSDIADNKTRNITVLQWPTPSGIDEIRARDICSNKLRQTTLWDACITMRGVNFSTTTETCVSDIKVGF